EPAPFSELPVRWSRAFGGAAIADNPDGIGAAPQGGLHALPNVMRPGERLRSPSDRLAPAGLSAIAIERPSRMQYAGSYDARWQRERAPPPPLDRDRRLFRRAPPDQWLAEPLEGDEALIVDHMHPTRPRLEGRLPGVRVRCLVSFDAEAEVLHEPSLRLE